MLKSWAGWPRGIRWLACAVAALLALAFVWALFVPIADWLARQDVGSAGGPLHETAVDNARGRLLTLGAGLAAVAALVFTALNFRLLRRNSEQADQWQRRTHELTEQGQVTDRYTKAIEQLGSDKLDVRIGGIYALERIARDSPRDHPTVMEVLTAFIREHSWEPWPLPRTEEEEDADLVEFTRPDVQAALTVVGRRDARHDIGFIDLIRADLTRADLTGAHLNGADLRWADLTGAHLNGADLSGANLTEAGLLGADFTSAHLDAAKLFGADLTRAHLSEAILSSANLTGANLTEAGLLGADLTGAGLTGANLTSAALLSAIVTGAILDGAILDGADLTGVRWPEGTPVPPGWELDAGPGRLRRAGNGSGAG